VDRDEVADRTGYFGRKLIGSDGALEAKRVHLFECKQEAGGRRA
jgi:hypothetical protein